MTYLLIFLFLALLGFVVYFYIKMNRERKRFQRQVVVLKDVIDHLNREQNKLNSRLVLSDELKQKISVANQSLSQSIYDLNIELFEESFPRRAH